MPISLIEAQIAGKAVVIGDAGGMPEMIKHGETGLISPTGQSEPIFRHLNTLLENNFMRNAISFNIQQWALKHWTIHTMTERLITIYRNMISNAHEAN